MPKVTAITEVEAPRSVVYALAEDIERFPEFMPDVQEVSILEKHEDGTQVSRWVGVIKEFHRTITWTEEDYWDAAKFTCTFRQLEGDFHLYQGTWTFAEKDNGTTEINLEVEYEYNVPLIGNLIKGILHRKMQENCDNMLVAIKDKAEAPG